MKTEEELWSKYFSGKSPLPNHYVYWENKVIRIVSPVYYIDIEGYAGNKDDFEFFFREPAIKIFNELVGMPAGTIKLYLAPRHLYKIEGNDEKALISTN